MSTIANGTFGSEQAVGPEFVPRTMAEQIALDCSLFYDISGAGFATTASIKINNDVTGSTITGIYERKPSAPDVFGQVESYIPTFRTPNTQASALVQGSELIVAKKRHWVTHVEKDSNGDTVLTLSRDEHGVE